MVFTPTKCDEVGVVCLKVKEYRKINGSWKLLGFTMRDIQINVRVESDENVSPELTVKDNYSFKIGEKTCFDITSWDTINSYTKSHNRGDTTRIKILNAPPGATLVYLDSSSGNKTGRFCWQVHDSVYHQLNNISKKIPLTIEVIDNFCPSPQFIRKTVFLKVLPPDSVGLVSSNIYIDKNKNRQKDNSEKGFHHRLKVKDKNSTYSIPTDTAGKYTGLFVKGQYTIGVAAHPYLESAKTDTSITVYKDSSYLLNIPVYKKHGIYGYVYRDINANCVFDKEDLPLRGCLIVDDSNRHVGISDDNGMYFIRVKNYGNYRFRCLFKKGELNVICPDSNYIHIAYLKDSAYEGKNFGISYNPEYHDVAVQFSFGRFRRGQTATIYLHNINRSAGKVKDLKVYIPVPANMTLKRDNTTLGNSGDTVELTIDSIQPFGTQIITLTVYVDANKFKALDSAWFEAFTDTLFLQKDSVKTNNHTRRFVIIDAPYDPNEKLIIGSATKTMLDKMIDYSIHFQNTGTDTAFRVMVTDTVDTRFLDLSGFEMNWSDAPCQTYLSGNVLYFIFESIRLPYLSVSGDKSISGFSFRLGLKSKITHEDSFRNRASIYFDFEEAVITKDALARIVSPTQIISVSKSGLCQQEPVHMQFRSQFTPESNNTYFLELSDADGSFENATLLRAKASALETDSFNFKAPTNLNGDFKLRIRSSSPASYGINASGLTAFNVMSKPDFKINTNMSNKRLCMNDTLELEMVSQKFQFKVLKNEQEISPFSTVKTYKFKLDLNDRFSVVAIDSSNLCTDTTHIQLEILEVPNTGLQLLSPMTDYCTGDILLMKASGALNYIFYGNQQIIRDYDSSDSCMFVLDSHKDFYVDGYNAEGCRSRSEIKSVEVNPLPAKPVILQNNNNLSIQWYPFISWYRDGILLSDTGNTIINAPGGTYQCIVADINSCENSSDEYLHLNTGIERVSSNEFKLYPNPAGDELNISNIRHEGFKVVFYDLTGKPVLSIKSETQDYRADLSMLESGIYNVRLISEDGSVYNVLISVVR